MNLNEIQDDIEAQMAGVRAYSGIEQSLEAECEHDAWASTCEACHERHHAEIVALKAGVERLVANEAAYAETARSSIEMLEQEIRRLKSVLEGPSAEGYLARDEVAG
jgi:cytochrome c553